MICTNKIFLISQIPKDENNFWWWNQIHQKTHWTQSWRPLDMFIYSAKLTNPGNLEHQYLHDLHVQTVGASPTQLVGEWMPNYNMYPSQWKHILRIPLSLKDQFKSMNPWAHAQNCSSLMQWQCTPTSLQSMHALEIINKYLGKNGSRFDCHAELSFQRWTFLL